MDKSKIQITPRKSSKEASADTQKSGIIIKPKSHLKPSDHRNQSAAIQQYWRTYKKHTLIGGGVILAVSLMVFLIFTPSDTESQTVDLKAVVPPQPDPKSGTWFGLSLEEHKILKQGRFNGLQSPASLLMTEGVAKTVIERLNKKSEKPPLHEKFKRKNYVLLAKRTEPELKIFAFETSPYQYWVLDISQAQYALNIHREIEQLPIHYATHIDSNIKKSLAPLPFSEDLGEKIEEALAWTVDFYHLSSDTKIKLLYEGTSVDGKLVDIDQLHAVWLQDSLEQYYAYYFENGEMKGFYGDNARPMKTSFLRAPVKYDRISSYFGKRFHPIKQQQKYHFGTDYAAKAGSPIYAVANGTVVEASYNQYNGYFVRLHHEDGYETVYLHIQKNTFPPDLKKGSYIKQGEIIGKVGQTGAATGPHVCFHIRKNGQAIDPLKVGLPQANPLPAWYLTDFFRQRDSLKEVLDGILYFE